MEEQKKYRQLRHEWVYTNKNGKELLVQAKDMNESNRNDGFYIRNHIGQIEEVILVIPVKNRKYFRTLSGNQHISISIKEYNESLVHQLAKQIISDKTKLPQIMIPSIEINNKEFSLTVVQARMVDIINCNLEVSKPDASIRLDAELTYRNFRTKANESTIGIEIYVTHRVDSEKQRKLKDNKIDTIEIDLSDLVKDKTLENDDLETKIIERLTSQSSKVYWVYNDTKNVVENKLIKNIAVLYASKNQYKQDSDGYWRVYPNITSGSNMKMCEMTNHIKNEYILEPICSKCPRFICTKGEGWNTKVYCNQLSVSINDLKLVSMLLNNAICNNKFKET